ncbi:MAG: DGQHR domain-containing protein [Gammaproteobacteria bacterium]|nr:DGQHR domain-containing protein [Gammaproteobacteria bacterium]
MASYQYPCLIYRQRQEVENTPSFCLFHAPVVDILKWADIQRLEDEPGAPQRRTSQAKVTAVQRFLTQEPRNTIPTSVIVALDLPESRVKHLNSNIQKSDNLGSLEFEMSENAKKPGLIIDGQHRLLGMKKADPNLNVNIVALLNADDMEKAFQFLVINNKASKVSNDHIRALALHYEKQQLDDRLKTARLHLDPNAGFVGLVDSEDGSPFKGIISWPLNPEKQRIVPPAAIEASINYIQQQKVKELESDDVLLAFFYAIWQTIKKQWSSLWHKESRLLTKMGVLGFTQYITDALVASYDWGELDISDPEQIVKHVKKLLINQEKNFWEVAWVPSSYDTMSGRALVVDSLVQISRNRRADNLWYADVKIIEVTQLEIIAEEQITT